MNKPENMIGLIALFLPWAVILAVSVLMAREDGWSRVRMGILRGALLCAAGVVASTECLSLAGLLSRGWVMTVWIAAAGVAAGIAAWRLKSGSVSLALRLPGLDGFSKAVLLGAGVWLAVLCVIAITAAPNNYDALTYRLTRVMVWAQNGSIEFFPTQITRQNDRPPFAEWVMLQMFLVGGGDRVFALVQWAALGLAALAAVEVASTLSASRAGCTFAAVVVLTTPMAILQATSIQTDLLAAAFLMAFVLFGLRFSRCAEFAPAPALFCGMALGGGILSKFPLAVFAVPFVLWFAVRALRNAKLPGCASGAICAVVAILLFSGHATRNTVAFGSPSGMAYDPAPRGFDFVESRDAGHFDHTNQAMDGRRFVSNVVRNVAVQLSGSNENFNAFWIWCVWKIHQALGIPMDLPDITWGAQPFELSALRHEDVAGNLPTVLVLIASFGFALATPRVRTRDLLVYALCLAAGGAAFCLLMKWELWHARLVLMLVLTAAPFAGVAMGAFSWASPVLSVALVTAALPSLLDNYMRPVFGEKSIFAIPRNVQYVRGNYERFSPFHEVARVLKKGKHKRIGLLTDVNDLHYPLWPVFLPIIKYPVAFEYVGVTNERKRLGESQVPDVVLATYPMAESEIEIGGARFVKVWSKGPLVVFEKPSEKQ